MLINLFFVQKYYIVYSMMSDNLFDITLSYINFSIFFLNRMLIKLVGLKCKCLKT